MAARSRLVGDLSAVGYSSWVIGGSTFIYRNNQQVIVDSRKCDDVVGNYPNNNPLFIDRSTLVSCDRLNGRQLLPGNDRVVINLIPAFYENITQIAPHIFFSTPPSPATTLLARTNPSRPNIQLPVSVLELRELPDLIRHLGRQLRPNGRPKKIPKNLAEANLVWQFGWAPLIGDLIKLAQFTDLVDKRVKELEKLQSGTGLRRRFTLAEGSLKGSGNTTIHSTNGSVTCKHETTTGYKQWGVVRWRPTGKLPQTESGRRALAMKAVLGLGLNYSNVAASAWEAIPWTWLIDWFANVGEFLQAHNNTVPAEPSGISIMLTRNTTKTFTRTSGSTWLTGGDATVSHITKERSIGSATLAASLPFLTGRQASILGSLAVIRSKTARRIAGT